MSISFRDAIVAMSAERPNARVSTIVALALAVENAVPDFDDPASFGKWARRQPEVARFLGTDETRSKINAIKELRALTRCSLVQAKSALDLEFR